MTHFLLLLGFFVVLSGLLGAAIATVFVGPVDAPVVCNHNHTDRGLCRAHNVENGWDF